MIKKIIAEKTKIYEVELKKIVSGKLKTLRSQSQGLTPADVKKIKAYRRNKTEKFKKFQNCNIKTILQNDSSLNLGKKSTIDLINIATVREGG